jgi:hypothetical protein
MMPKLHLTILLFLGLFPFSLLSGISLAGNAVDEIGQRFTGEMLKYEVGFWIFFPIGGGVADFRNLGNGKYMVYHEGKAEGLVGWLTSHRREVYRSTMRTINNGQRLIPLRFEENSIIGKWFRKKTTVYDYAARKIFIEIEKEGEKKREEIEIPTGILYDDPVTTFYNFRFGVYGKVEAGKEFLVRILPEKGKETIRLKVASKEETEIKRAEETDKSGKDFFVRILLDREMWGKKKGEVEIWFTKELIPASGVVKDIRFFGDIKGKLSDRWVKNSPETVPSPLGKDPPRGE